MKRKTRSGILLGCLTWLVAGALGSGTVPCALAQQTIETFVTRSYRGSDVLRVDSEHSQPPTASFATTKVTILNPKRKSPQDRAFEVVFYMSSWTHSREAYGYSVPAKLLQGQSQVTVEIPHPLPSPQFAWKVMVYENGRSIEDRRQTGPNVASFNYGYLDGSTVSTVAALQGQAETQDSVNQSLDSVLQNALINTTATVNGRIFPTPNANSTRVSIGYRVVPTSSASDDWRTYMPFTCWVVSANTLKEINESRAPVAAALRHYVASGGSVLVHGVENQELMGEVEQWLGFESLSDGGRNRQMVKIAKTAEVESESVDEFGERQVEKEELATEQVPITAERWGVEMLGSDEILTQDFLAGRILILPEPLDAGSKDLVVQVLKRNAGQNVASLSAVESDSNWFWRNLIEAVGRPPVWIFCGLVGLFGAILGPGLLFFTARQRRRSLMIFLVPLVSLLATMSIIAYGVLHEGFATYARVTSVSRFDFDANSGFAWSRQSYFSGQPPRGGMVFNRDTYARPVVAENENYYRAADPVKDSQYRVALSEHGQVWKGWLKPRTQQQLLVGHPLTRFDSPFEFERIEKQLKVSNRSVQDLPFAAFRGEEENYFFVEDFKAGDSIVLEPETEAEVAAHIAQAMVPLKPKLPVELEGGGTLNLGLGNRRSRTTSYEGNDVINLSINNYFSDKLEMVPYSFATILRENAAIEMPFDRSDSEAGGGTEVVAEGLHILIGNQTW